MSTSTAFSLLSKCGPWHKALEMVTAQLLHPKRY